MTKKFAPLAVLFGLLGALLLGGAAVGNAADGDYKCNQNGVSVVNVQCSNILNNITVNVKDVRVLTDNEIVKLENVLNNTDVNIEDIEAKVLNVFINDFKIDIDDTDVTVCITVGSIKTCT